MAGEVRFTPTEDDAAKGARDWYADSLRRPRTVARIALVILLYAMLPVIIPLVTERRIHPSPRAIATCAAAGTAIIAALLAFYWWRAGPWARRLCRQQRLRADWYRFAWSADGLDVALPHGAARYGWSELIRWREARSSFLFFVNDRQYVALPLRVLTSDQLADLRDEAAAARERLAGGGGPA